MKKLYMVTATIEIIVAAEDEADALEICKKDKYIFTALAPEENTLKVSNMTHLPSGYDEGCFPYGWCEIDVECSIGEYIAKGAAPQYKEKVQE